MFIFSSKYDSLGHRSSYEFCYIYNSLCTIITSTGAQNGCHIYARDYDDIRKKAFLFVKAVDEECANYGPQEFFRVYEMSR